jgi:hypothetical protein
MLGGLTHSQMRHIGMHSPRIQQTLAVGHINTGRCSTDRKTAAPKQNPFAEKKVPQFIPTTEADDVCGWWDIDETPLAGNVLRSLVLCCGVAWMVKTVRALSQHHQLLRSFSLHGPSCTSSGFRVWHAAALAAHYSCRAMTHRQHFVLPDHEHSGYTVRPPLRA